MLEQSKQTEADFLQEESMHSPSLLIDTKYQSIPVLSPINDKSLFNIKEG